MADDIDKLVDESEVVEKDGFKDPSNNYPRKEYDNIASTNLASRGLKQNELYIGGGSTNLNLDLRENGTSQYPLNQVRETISGHVTEVDDTPNNERLLWKHKTGSGVEMRSDGTVVVSSRHNTIHITGGDQKILVEGDGDIHYLGNLRLHVTGDMDVDVGGDYNLTVHGDKKEEVYGGSSTTVHENKVETVSGNNSSFTAGSNTDTVLSDNNLIVKGNQTERIGAKLAQYVGDNITMTAPNDMNFTSKSINIAATDLSAIATTGVIGGDNVIYYAKNYYGTSSTFTDGVTAPAFHGDLQGTAVRSITADVTNSQNYADTDPGGDTGSAQGYTADNTATDTTVRGSVNPPGPTSTTMDDYLNKSNLGIRNVKIDPGDVMKNTIDKSNSYGGISKYGLTTEMVRSKLRDPNTARNDKFFGRALAEGILSTSYVAQKPEMFDIGRVDNDTSSSKLPSGKMLGNEITFPERIANESNTVVVRTLIPNQLYNPELQFAKYGKITGKTKLARGISLAKFLGGYGDPVTLDHVTDDTERLKIARNLYAHAEFVKTVQEHLEKSNHHRIVVAEGLYKKQSGEVLDPDSLNYLAARGQVIVYEIRDRKGDIDHETTFDIAQFAKDYTNFDKMILDYDSYNPDDSLNAQLIIQMPPVNADWNMRFRNDFETRYNNFTQANGELVEIVEQTETEVVIDDH